MDIILHTLDQLRCGQKRLLGQVVDPPLICAAPILPEQLPCNGKGDMAEDRQLDKGNQAQQQTVGDRHYIKP